MKTTSERLFAQSKKFLPGGVNSPVRAFKAVGGTPPFIKDAYGAWLTDMDDNPYIDYVGSWGPMILGHADPDVVKTLEYAVHKGTSYGMPSPLEAELAEIIVDRVDSVDMVRFVNSGTEATMSAIRLARAATERETIIKFAGCYHGHADSFLIQAGSGVATFGLPDSPGVTRGAAKDTRIAIYNDLDSVEEIFEAEGETVAAVIVEPVAGNMGVIPPNPGFLEGLRRLCDEYGALLILDEVMTGFRVAYGGAQELYSITPDLTTFGKVIGGGLPVGAYGGSEELMRKISPDGPVYQAGTLSGNPLAMAAGIATMKKLSEDSYQQLETAGEHLEDQLGSVLAGAGFPSIIQRVGSMLTLFFTDKPVENFDDAASADHERFGAFFNAMLTNGIHLPPSGYEAWFISLVHDEDVIARTIQAVEKSLSEL